MNAVSRIRRSFGFEQLRSRRVCLRALVMLLCTSCQETSTDQTFADPPSGRPLSREPFVPQPSPPPDVPLAPKVAPRLAFRLSPTTDDIGCRPTADSPDFIRKLLTDTDSLIKAGQRARAATLMEDFFAHAPAGISAPDEASLWCALGAIYASSHSIEKAQLAYSNALEKFRYYPDTHYQLCRQLKSPEGKEACKAYLALDPDGPHAAAAEMLLKAP